MKHFLAGAASALLIAVAGLALAQGPKHGGPGPSGTSLFTQVGPAISPTDPTTGWTWPSTVTGGFKGAGSINFTSGYIGGTAISTAAALASFSGGTTGLTPAPATGGDVALGGTLAGASGGTGVVNSGSSIALGGNLTTSGAFNTTLTATGSTAVTLPTSATLLTVPLGLGTLATEAANTVVANATAGTAAPTAVAVTDCHTAGSAALRYTAGAGFGCGSIVGTPISGTPVANQIVTFANATTVQGVSAYPNGTTATSQSAGDASTKVSTNAYADTYAVHPQGRLTLATATPVMSSNVTAATTIFYTPYNGGLVPIFNGSQYVATPFIELSNITTNSATGKAGPAAVTTNSNYDLFVWNDAGTIRLTRGPPWTSDTARGTGAGTTQISRVLGLWTNTVAITNGPGAGLGTYVGTVRSNGSSQIDWTPHSAPAAGGTNAVVGVYNAYNRVMLRAFSQDSTLSWSYNTTTWRALDNSASNRVSFIDGLGESDISAFLLQASRNDQLQFTGVEMDSTSTAPPCSIQTWNLTSTPGVDCAFGGTLGFHFISGVEWGSGGGSVADRSGSSQLNNTGVFFAQSQVLRLSLQF